MIITSRFLQDTALIYPNLSRKTTTLFKSELYAIIRKMELLGISTSNITWILLYSLILWLLTLLLSKLFVTALSVGTPTGRRLKTLNSLVKASASVVILAVAGFMILKEVGFDATPLLASAGIAGLAIGFGAQTLVKDVIAGAFILIENQFGEGDEIEISGKSGIVEKISLRTVWLKDKKGAVHMIPNGNITMVTNFSKNEKRSS